MDEQLMVERMEDGGEPWSSEPGLTGSAEDWAWMAREAAKRTVVEVITITVPFGRTVRMVQRRVIRTRRPNEMC